MQKKQDGQPLITVEADRCSWLSSTPVIARKVTNKF